MISVITPTWNRGASAEKTVSSILNQTFQDFEYIIVDDGSLPEHKEYFKKLTDKRVKVLFLPEHTESHPPALARNTGIKAAKGKYVVCIDDDDWLDPTYLEKAVSVLECNPGVEIATAYQKMFGARSDVYKYSKYNAINMLHDNMVMHSAMYKRDAWEKVGGYKEGVKYEDWEFWISLAENGSWAQLIPEPLFNYQVALKNSRYTEDINTHADNIKKIKALHPSFKKNVEKLTKARRYVNLKIDYKSAFDNLLDKKQYKPLQGKKGNVLIAIPWMTFGGAETLIYNFCKEIKNTYNISFITGLDSEHEWEYKFKEVSERIYHLHNLFENDKGLYLEFISNYISTRDIDVLHIIHNGFVFEMLPEIKKRHPKLKVIVTMFNDRVNYFEQSVSFKEYIDIFTSDNQVVGNHYKESIDSDAVKVIPNGIDCYDNFNKDLFNLEAERSELGINKDDVSVFFIGRLSEEKCPDVFLDVAKSVLNQKNIKFFMVGDGPMKDYLLKKIDKESINNIRYLGYQSDIAKYLASADIFVLPSRIEGFPLSVLEAMAMKATVIASKVGAVPDVITSGSNGYVVTPSSTKEISEIVLELSNNKDKLTAIGAAARRDVELQYSNLKLKSNYISLYKEAIK